MQVASVHNLHDMHVLIFLVSKGQKTNLSLKLFKLSRQAFGFLH